MAARLSTTHSMNNHPITEALRAFSQQHQTTDLHSGIQFGRTQDSLLSVGTGRRNPIPQVITELQSLQQGGVGSCNGLLLMLDLQKDAMQGSMNVYR